MAIGTVVWGHCREEINNAILDQLKKGVSFSVPARIEMEVAEKILSRIGHYKHIRFCKNGADAVTAALRLARAITGRIKVICGSYHGWHEWSATGYYGKKNNVLGIPKEIASLTIWLPEESINDIKLAIEKNHDEVACIVVCPDHWSKADLKKLREICNSNNILFVFDEVVSGLRFAKRGVSGEYEIWPDVLCISKGLANGLPLASILTTEEFMPHFNKIKFSNTHSTDSLSLAAASAAEELLRKALEWPTWKHQANKMIAEIKAEIIRMELTAKLRVSGHAGDFRIHTPGKNILNDSFREHFVKHLAKEDIYSRGYILLSDTHTNIQIEIIKNAIINSIKAWGEIVSH